MNTKYKRYELALPPNVAHLFDQLGDVNILHNQLEHNPQPILVTDKSGKMVYVNRQLLELTGYTRDELLGKSPGIFNSGAQPKEFYQRLWNTLKNGEKFEARFKNRRKDGSEYWVYSTISPLKNTDNENSGYISIQEDITSLVKIETQSITNETILISLLKNLSGIGIFLLETQSPKIFVTEGELVHEFFPGKIPSINEFNTYFDNAEVDLGKNIREMQEKNAVIRKKIKNRQHTYDFTIAPVYFGESSQLYAAVIIRDVTNYQHIIERVQKSEQQLEAIFQNAGIGIGILDAKGNYIRTNTGWADMMGYAKNEILQKNVNEFIHPYDMKKHQPEMQKLIKGIIHNVRHEMRFVKKNNEILWGDVNLTTITNKYQKTEAVIAVVSDITDNKKTQEALARSEQKYKALNKTKDRFFSIVAHDLKNPFGSIIGLSELAIESPEETSHEKAIEYLSAINQTANQAQSLLQNLLEWSRMQTGSIKPVLVHSDLHEIVEDVLELVKTMADAKNITIHNHIGVGTIALCDYQMMNTVIRNLLSNAIKYSYQNSVIEIGINQQNQNVVMYISDSGTGIPSDMHEKLFTDDLQQSAPGTANEKGTGLGLVLVNDFIKMNNGKVTFNSKKGEGTTFYIHLPRND